MNAQMILYSLGIAACIVLVMFIALTKMNNCNKKPNN